MQLGYGVETGEAERIAVDGVSRGGQREGDESGSELSHWYQVHGAYDSCWQFDDAEKRHQDAV